MVWRRDCTGGHVQKRILRQGDVGRCLLQESARVGQDGNTLLEVLSLHLTLKLALTITNSIMLKHVSGSEVHVHVCVSGCEVMSHKSVYVKVQYLWIFVWV